MHCWRDVSTRQGSHGRISTNRSSRVKRREYLTAFLFSFPFLSPHMLGVGRVALPRDCHFTYP